MPLLVKVGFARQNTNTTQNRHFAFGLLSSAAPTDPAGQLDLSFPSWVLGLKSWLAVAVAIDHFKPEPSRAAAIAGCMTGKWLRPGTSAEKRSMPLQTRALAFSIGQLYFNTDGKCT